MRDEEIYRAVGQRIAAKRRELKMTQSELGDRVLMSRASVANIEGGRQNVLLHHLYRFSKALSMSSVADLLPVAIDAKLDDALLGVSFSDESISPTTRAVVGGLLSRAQLQRKGKL